MAVMTAPAAAPKPVNPSIEPDSAAPPGDAAQASSQASSQATAAKKPREIGGPTGPEPTRYGDWERNGRVSDF